MPLAIANQYGKTTKRGEGKITSEIRERLKQLLVDTLVVSSSTHKPDRKNLD